MNKLFHLGNNVKDVLYAASNRRDLFTHFRFVTFLELFEIVFNICII